MRQSKRLSVFMLFFMMILLQTILAVWGVQSVPASETSGTQSQNVLILYDTDGTEYQRIYAGKKKVSLPTMAAKKGYTFLGWSSKKGKGKNPEYEVGDKVTVFGTVRLYAVFFNRSREADLNVSGLSSGYDQVIFVGDSRTNGMKLALQQEYGSGKIKNVSFVAKNGSGLKWLKNTGEKRLKQLVRQARQRNQNARIAVVFNHGVNDLKHSEDTSIDVSRLAGEYASYMKKLGKALQKEGCDLYYMSVNPVNSGKHSTEMRRRSTEVRSFNKLLKRKLKGQYTFIGTYSYLLENGYSTEHFADGTHKDDGIHYSVKTYKRIYAYCMKSLRAGSSR